MNKTYRRACLEKALLIIASLILACLAVFGDFPSQPRPQSAAGTFVRVELEGNIPPWSEPTPLPGNHLWER